MGVLTCQRCQAPLPAPVGSFVTCSYCGATSNVATGQPAAPAAPAGPSFEDRNKAGMTKNKKTWKWKGEGGFNPVYDAQASDDGLEYYCEIQGPFCGYDREGGQTWKAFLAEGPPSGIQMPGDVEAAIRAFAEQHDYR